MFVLQMGLVTVISASRQAGVGTHWVERRTVPDGGRILAEGPLLGCGKWISESSTGTPILAPGGLSTPAVGSGIIQDHHQYFSELLSIFARAYRNRP